MRTVKVTRRYGMVYSGKPWVVSIKCGVNKDVRRFKTENEARKFADGC